MIPGGAIVTAELAGLAVDQCALVDERFTLLAPDNYRSDYLEVKLWDRRGSELAVESLYVDDDEGDEDEDDARGGRHRRLNAGEGGGELGADLFVGEGVVAGGGAGRAFGLQGWLVLGAFVLGFGAAGVKAAR